MRFRASILAATSLLLLASGMSGCADAQSGEDASAKEAPTHAHDAILAPNFTLPVIVSAKNAEPETAKPISLKNYKGRVVYLDFWASWCAPCLASMPELNALRNDYSNLGFELLSVNVDMDVDAALRFLDKMTIDHPVLRDADQSLKIAYSVEGLPTGFLIDHHGQIILRHEGYRPADRDFLAAHINRALTRAAWDIADNSSLNNETVDATNLKVMRSEGDQNDG